MSTCSLCAHPDVADIDAALAAGGSRRAVSQRFGVGEASVQRHRADHLSPALVTAATNAAEAQRFVTLIDRLELQATRLERVIEAQEAKGSVGTMLAAIRELRAMLELLGKATGELKPDGVHVTLNLATNPEWLEVQRRLLDALAPYPEARIAVAAALGGYETKELGP